MFCKKCGKYIQPDQNFCPTCGTPVENNNTESMGDTKVIPGLNNMEDMGDTKVIPNLNELENQKSFGNNTNSFDNIDDSDFPEEIEYVEDKIEGFDFPEEPEEEFEFDSDENEEYVVDDEDEIDKSMITNENKKLNIIAIVVSVVIVIGIVIAAIILTKSF